MRRIASIALSLCFIPIVGGILIAVIGSPDGHKFGPYWPLGAVVTVLGFVIPLLLWWKARAVGQAEFEDAATTDFTATAKGWYDGSGIAVDFTRKQVLLADPGRRGIVPFDDLRDWHYAAGRRAAIVPVNPLGMALTAASLASTGSYNREKAGFWVNTASGRWRLLGLQPASAKYWIDFLDMARRGETPKGLFGIDTSPPRSIVTSR